MDLARKSLGLRLDYWSATVRMMTEPGHVDRVLFGLGPGMFGRYYPRYMNWQATEKISDPHNFILELWATSGTMAALLIVLILALALRWCLLRPAVMPADPPVSDPPRVSVPRHFAYAGMAGFVLAFALAAMNQEPDALIGSASMSLARMLIWVVAFFAFASGAYPARLLSTSLGAGVSACLINCLVSGGISFPALAQCLWAAIALACPAGTVTRPNRQAAHLWLLTGIVSAILVLYYIGTVYWPVTQASRYSTQARSAMASLSPGKSESASVRDARLVKPLEQAVSRDPEDASSWAALADGYGMLWRLDRAHDVLKKALEAARNSTRIDPEGKEGYLAEYRLGQSAAGREGETMLELSARAMRQVIERDPSEAKWHYLLADVLRKSGQKTEASAEAEKARDLDQLAGSGPRRLSGRQREQLDHWLRENR
jgi:cytochrome c-type biogenesis protein CcmH/NrfG